MSESIEYQLNANDLTQEQGELLATCCKKLGEGTLDYTTPYVWGYFQGSRGGGMTCADIISEALEPFHNKHPNARVTVYAVYLEQAPCELEYTQGEEE